MWGDSSSVFNTQHFSSGQRNGVWCQTAECDHEIMYIQIDALCSSGFYGSEAELMKRRKHAAALQDEATAACLYM